MITQNESRLPQQRAKPSWRKDGTTALVHRAVAPPPKRGVFVPEKGPTFLKVYVIPVLLLNLALVGCGRLGCRRCACSTRFVDLFRLCCDRHGEPVPLPGIPGTLPALAQVARDKKMISHNTLTDIRESTRLVETTANDIEALTQCGYATDEIISLLWLRQYYQSGGSDRAAIVRSLEFLRYLAMSGKLEA